MGKQSYSKGHGFYCVNCGKEGIPLFRKPGRTREKFHRKRLYCPWCKKECNHIEVRNDVEKQAFLEAFHKGEFKEEAMESIKHCKGVI